MKTAKRISPQETVELLRETVLQYVSEPAKVEIRMQESEDGAVYFAMRGSPIDDSRLIGKEGRHVNAVRRLVADVGLAQGRPFTFRLVTNPERYGPWSDYRDALEYNPKPMTALLSRWLAALGVDNATITVGPGTGERTSLNFNFEIKVKDPKLSGALNLKDNEGSTVDALDTIWRAIAKQSGVRFRVFLLPTTWT